MQTEETKFKLILGTKYIKWKQRCLRYPGDYDLFVWTESIFILEKYTAINMG